jgi:sugar-specific transcriptional regulator TrmB
MKVEHELQLRRLQHIGLNTYESRAYLVLIGHPRFKALEVAGRARIPRQKIYEVLDSLVEKGFVQVVQGKAKQFSAVEPQMALQSYLSRKKEAFEREWQDRHGLAHLLTADLSEVYANGTRGRGTLDYLRIVADTGQIGEEYRRLLLQTHQEYLEFARPPYAVDPAREPLVARLLDQGIKCRLIFDSQALTEHNSLHVLKEAGAQVRLSSELPLKLALFDNEAGMISLDDPVVSHPQITALVFEHHSLSTAMRSLFDDFWKRGTKV